MQIYNELRFTAPEVNAAGQLLYRSKAPASEEDRLKASEIVGNWRDAHNYPLHIIKKRLQLHARKVDPQNIVAQRIKRIRAVEAKLSRYPEMRLAQMQDIGGCRVIVNDIAMVREIVRRHKEGRIEHQLVGEKDYISAPRDTGYRSHHLIYRFKPESEERKSYTDLKIEIQIRSKLQHAWATAVETVDFFTSHALHSLKSSQGPEAWQRFFRLMGTAIALREDCPPEPGCPSNESQIRDELKVLTKTLDVEGRLQAFAEALTKVPAGQRVYASYYLLELDLDAHEIKITGYRKRHLEAAQAQYFALEKHLPKSHDVVLVAVNSLKGLQKAFPNYHADTRLFVRTMKAIAQGNPL